MGIRRAPYGHMSYFIRTYPSLMAFSTGGLIAGLKIGLRNIRIKKMYMGEKKNNLILEF